jgi:hypothetical protein
VEQNSEFSCPSSLLVQMQMAVPTAEGVGQEEKSRSAVLFPKPIALTLEAPQAAVEGAEDRESKKD